MAQRSSKGVLAVAAACVALTATLCLAREPPLQAEAFRARAAADLAALDVYRQGLARALEFVHSRPDLFPWQASHPPRVLREDQRAEVLGVWKAVLDYLLALDSVGRHHADVDAQEDEGRARESFRVAHGAFLAGYAFALRFIPAVERDPSLGIVMNEAAPDLGVPKRTYARFKLRFLHVGRAAEFAAQRALFKAMWVGRTAAGEQALREDAAVIVKAGVSEGPLLTLKNAMRIVRDAGFTAWFPVQAGVSEWMGDVKVHRRKTVLITAGQIAELAGKLEPGDILLERREWYLSNIGLPGFWPHAALYVGTAQERGAYFDDAATRAWLARLPGAPGSVEEWLQAKAPEAYAASRATLEEGHLPRVIEAVSEGVLFTSLEHSAASDSLAVLRPRLGKADKAAAVGRAFGYVGRPYDFDFNFVTDGAMVCTEVIYKAYQPAPGVTGLPMPLINIMGRSVMPANELARWAAEGAGTEQAPLELIVFLDGHERTRAATPRDLEAFRQSVTRPKWHVLMP